MDYNAARKQALRFLSMRSYHSAVLKQKLMQKGVSEQVASKVVEDCEKMGFLNDEEAILNELKKGRGPRLIEYMLKLPSSEVRKWITEEKQREMILRIYKKIKDRKKAYQTLYRKGFDPDLMIELFQSE